MLNYFRLIFLLISISLELATCAENQYAGRLFRDAYTKTIIQAKIVTSLVPSSCVQVEATLPPCRNVRYLKFPKLPSITFNNPDKQEDVSNWKPEEKIETTPLGWGEYLGLYAPTVTVTTTNLQISTVQDPSVVVTFAIKGCRPLKLPMDLNRCPVEASQSIPVEGTLATSTFIPPIVPTASILPTSTMTLVNPTTMVLEGLTNLPEKQPFPENSNLLEPTPQELRENRSVLPTQALK